MLSQPRPYHLYAHVVPSQHASDTASHPYACVVPSRHAPDTAYHPYARGSALLTCSQHHLSLRLCSALPTSSQHCLPSLCSQSALPTCSRHCLSSLCSLSALPTCSQHHLSLRLCSALPTSSQHCLPSLRSWGSFPTCSRHCLPSLCLRSALPTCSRHHLSLRLCSALPTPLILTLAECPPNMLLKRLILMLPYYIHSVRWLVGVHNERNRQNMLSGLLCQQDLRGNWSVYSQCCG
ncbi:hypothetical protein O181_125228 [Austropuccinia psidii MF-1]|uniref:Uncharacterized protein n=1 Tax=Austropuccinia psidii MF-1 TaxID=1389203 RepID=A0A9Q3Q4U7_9BASI|nr:hypothetical protein [Austropuccinia psidii MF-1]